MNGEYSYALRTDQCYHPSDEVVHDKTEIISSQDPFFTVTAQNPKITYIALSRTGVGAHIQNP